MSLIKILLISLLFYYSLNFNFNSDFLDFPIYEANETIIEKVLNGVIEMVMDYAAKIDILSGLSRECKNVLDRTFFIKKKNDTEKEELYLAYYYYSKIILDSSTNVNDLSSYINCMERNHQYNFSESKRKPLNPNYLTVFADYREMLIEYFKTGNRTTTYLVGICFVKNCNENDHMLMLGKIMKLIGLIKEDQYFNLKVYSLNKQDYKLSFKSVFFKFIPLYIITIHLFIVLFHKFLEFLYKKIKDLCCDTHQSIKIVPRIHKIEEEEDSNSNLNNSFINKRKNSEIKIKYQNFRNYIKALFDINGNFDFLIKKEDINEIHNDSSLSYMNGIKGISMITTLFGFVFIDLYNAPVTKYTMENFYYIMSDFLFFIFYFGIKFAPKLLICSSGFSLFYKFMCFLDDKFESEKAIKKVQEEEKKKEIISNLSSSKEKINEMNDCSSRTSSYYDSSSEYNKKKAKFNIPIKYYFLFIASQLHKFILYLLILFFILFSLFNFALIFIDLGPMWNFFNNNVIETSKNFWSIFPSLFCFQGYFLNSLNKDSILNYFYLVYQEVTYFIISTLFIFLGYKYHLRIDRFILLTMLILWLFRSIYYMVSNLNVKEYFSFYGYFFFHNSIINNYLYYLLGIYFGCLNYVIQKRYNYYECDNQGKTYLLGFTRLLKIIKKKSKLLFYSLGIFFLVLIIIFAFGQFLLFKYILFIKEYDDQKSDGIKNILNYYFDDKFIGIVMLIDTDVVVLLVNLMALFFYLKGENIIYDFLKISFWRNFNKLYFSFILLANPLILYVFYITESRIIFNIQNCFLYSFACGILLFSLDILVYAIFELPFKKTIRLFLKRNEIKVGQKTLGFMENNSIVYKQMDLKGGDLAKSRKDSCALDDNDEDIDNDDNNKEIKLKEKFIENDE